MSLAATVLLTWLGASGGGPALLPRLPAAEVLCGRFEQHRTMPQLARPLRSEGRFIASRSRGLAWIQTAPFDSLLVVDEARMTQQVGTYPPVTISARDQPVMFSFSRVLLQIFAGASQELEEHFEVSLEEADPDWSMRLVPKAGLLRDAVQSIRVTGGEYLEEIVVLGSRGDDTRISLRDVVDCAGELSDADGRLFELR